ncbi:MAG: 3-deoxy-D-manno-octulosonic acid transferase [Planktomarina sp.]
MDLLRPGTGPLAWAHVGSASALCAVQEVILRAQAIEPTVQAIITTTPDSGVYGPEIHQLSDETTTAAQQFLTQIAPDLCIWCDASINSPFVTQTHKSDIPVMLLTPHTQAMRKRPWLWRKTVARQALRPVAFALAETSEAASHLRALGVPAPQIEVLGPLNPGIMPLRCNENERDQLGDILTSRPVWLAVQVPADELDLIVHAFVRAQRSAHRMVLLLDLQDPKDDALIDPLFSKHGLTVHRRAVEGEPDTLTQVFVTDETFELGLWYRLATLAYMGGTFTGTTTADPLDAAALGSAVVHGPKTGQFTQSYDRLSQGDASCLTPNSDDLGVNVARLLEPDQCAALATAGWDVISQGSAVTDRLVDVTLHHLGFEGETP